MENIIDKINNLNFEEYKAKSEIGQNDNRLSSFEMINTYQIQEQNCDFMGYYKYKDFHPSFHHLIVPRRCGGTNDPKNGSMLYENSHRYLHLIETLDIESFDKLTYEMMLINMQGYIASENLYVINDILTNFEKNYLGKKSHRNKPIIKDEYLKRYYKK